MNRTHQLSALLALVMIVPAARAGWIPTNYGIGADCEVRESAPTTNRGTNTEIASRVKNAVPAGDPADGNDRNSAIYTKFDLTNLSMPGDGQTAFRMTYRNNNLRGSRIQDTVTPNPAIRTGLAIYGLKAGLTWDESTLTYLNAPGITFDGNVGTKDFNSDLTFLGTVAFPEIGTQNWLPVGGALEFRSTKLNTFVADAIAGGATELTLVSTVIHDGGALFPDWINFNYLFNPKDMVTLNNDPNYDSDTTDPDNPVGSPWSGADNSTGLFSPSILLVPEPSSVVLSMIALALVTWLRRRG
ncbi:MAG: PEP-CTERM sorting domain-containing protein [Pirellulales bacterium]|nr:PEP-CTERM sorting domain-containing protein [Pirellulales bacterium]